jgi:hypothetical protein
MATVTCVKCHMIFGSAERVEIYEARPYHAHCAKAKRREAQCSMPNAPGAVERQLSLVHSSVVSMPGATARGAVRA